jgi:hypothetical protein
MTKRESDTWPIRAAEPIAVCYICDTVRWTDRKPFIHCLPDNVIEPWHYRSLEGSTSVLLVLPLGWAP